MIIYRSREMTCNEILKEVDVRTDELNFFSDDCEIIIIITIENYIVTSQCI